MVSKTQFAITGEDTRYFLNGALFILRPDSMGLVVDRRPSARAHHRAARQEQEPPKSRRRGAGDPAAEDAAASSVAC